MIEYEGKILDVDPEVVDLRILNAGGKYLGEALQRRYVFDVVAGDSSRWLRLRETPSGTTLAMKRVRHSGLDGTDEYEIRVGGFAETYGLLTALGYEARGYQENRRRSYVLRDAAVEVDSWPLLPGPYMEIEGRSSAHVMETAALLGFREEQVSGISTVDVYARYGIDLLDHPELRFQEEGRDEPAIDRI